MGAWEIGNFGNDDALDFVNDVEENGKAVILNAIEKISGASQNEYLEAPECCMALAAIEYIAAAKDKPSEDFPEECAAWLEENELLPFKTKGILGIGSTEIAIVALCLQAIDRIKTKSELLELWQESDESEAWLNLLNDLKKRIS
jgi:hypothetical protein